MKNYDVLIIGAGIAGICTAYELVKQRSDLKICILEKGNSIYNRKCPVVEDKARKCVNCPSCSIMEGFGGAGSFSDGKYNITTEFGGWLNRYISDEELLKLIEYVDSINVSFGACNEVFSTQSKEAIEIEKKILGQDMRLLHAKVKHLGTENNLKILTNMYEYLKDKVEIRFKAKVEDIEVLYKSYKVILKDGSTVHSKYLVASPGRSGAKWFKDICTKR